MRNSNGTKKKKSKNLKGDRPKKPRVHEDIFSSSDHVESKTNDEPNRDLFSSDEAYEKAKKGSVLEKIHVLEEEIGDKSEVIEDEARIVPTIINRNMVSDVIRAYEAPKNSRDKKHDIPHRVIRSVKTSNAGKRFESKDDSPKREYSDISSSGEIEIETESFAPAENAEELAATRRIEFKKSAKKSAPENVPDESIGGEKAESATASEKAQSGDERPKKRKVRKKSAAVKKSEPSPAAETTAEKEEETVHEDAAPTENETAGKISTAESVLETQLEEELIKISEESVSKPELPADDETAAEVDAGAEEETQTSEAAAVSDDEIAETDEPQSEQIAAEDNADVQEESVQETSVSETETQTETETVSDVSDKETEPETEVNPAPAPVKKKKKKRPVSSDGTDESTKKKSVKKKKVKPAEGESAVKSRDIPDTAERLRKERLQKAKKAAAAAAAESGAEQPKPKKKKRPADNLDVKSEGAPKKSVKKTKKSDSSDSTPSKKKKRIQKNETAEKSAKFAADDVEKNKYLAAVAYLGILVVIPAVKGRDSEFCKAHVRQGVSVLLWSLCISLVTLGAALGLRALLVWVLGLPFLIYKVLLLAVVALMLTLIFIPVFTGAVGAFSGMYKRVPFVGKNRK